MASSASTWPDRVDLATLDLGERIGEGGEGEVLLLEGSPHTVFKRYSSRQLAARRQSTLESQTKTRSLLRVDGETIDRWSAWPHTLVFDQGQPVGFLMPRIPNEFTVVIADRIYLADLSYLASQPKPIWGTKFVSPNTSSRLEILGKLAAVLDVLHSRGYVYGDISFANVVWSARGQSRIMLLDCDGVTDTQSGVVDAPKDTVDWHDPLSIGTTPNADTDSYKLSLAVLRVLTQQLAPRPRVGQHWHLPDDLHPETERSIRQLLQRAAGPSGQRPSAAEWVRVLRRRDSVPLSPVTRRPITSLPVAEGIMHDPSPTRTLVPLNPVSASPAPAVDAERAMILELVVPMAPIDMGLAEAMADVVALLRSHPMACHIALGWTCYGNDASTPAESPVDRQQTLAEPPVGPIPDSFGDVFHRTSRKLNEGVAALKSKGFRVLRPAVIVLQPADVLETEPLDAADLLDPANLRRPNISIVVGPGVDAAGFAPVAAHGEGDHFTDRLSAEVRRVADRLAREIQRTT